MAEPAPEHFSGTADRITAARILRDRIGPEGKLGPDPASAQDEVDVDGRDMSTVLTLLLRWSSTRSSSE